MAIRFQSVDFTLQGEWLSREVGLFLKKLTIRGVAIRPEGQQALARKAFNDTAFAVQNCAAWRNHPTKNVATVGYRPIGILNAM